MTIRRIPLVLALVLAAGVLPSAQERAAQQEQAFKFRLGVELINVNATVTDQSGRFVSGLTQDDFRVFEDEQPQTVTHFSAERVPVSLGIVLDTSGSMDGEKMHAAKQALERFLVQLLDPEDEVFLYRFDDTPQLVEGWTRDKRLLSDALARIRPRGGTALYDAVADAVHLAQQGRNKKKAVVIISDGNDTNSRTDVYSVKQLIRESEVLVYAIGIDAPGTPFSRFPLTADRLPLSAGRLPLTADRSPLSAFRLPLTAYRALTANRLPLSGSRLQRPRPPSTPIPMPFPIPGGRRPNPLPPPQPPANPIPNPGGGGSSKTRNSATDDRVNVTALRDITDDSGGRTEIVRFTRDLDPATAGIADELSKQYYLGYGATGPKDGRWHAIRVEVRNGAYHVRARRGYVASRQ
jgi:Mg-chelatase subunit ChlD